MKSGAYLEIYFMVIDGDPLILVFYVDDLFLIGAKRPIIGLKRELASSLR
jgi:hypothetical protein